MKKLLGIVILGLLWCNTLYSIELKDLDEIAVDAHWTGLDKQEAAGICGSKDKFYFSFKYIDYQKGYVPTDKYIIICSREYLSFNPFHKGSSVVKHTNYSESIKANWDKKYNNNPKVIKDNLTAIKNTCLEFGYQEGTEKLADCMKDLYLKKTQTTNKIIQGSNTGTTTKAKRKIDPSVWDDLLKLGGISSVTSSSSSSSSSAMPKGTCYNTGEETGGTNKSCRYSCSGNIVTITISSLEVCPLHIQR